MCLFLCGCVDVFCVLVAPAAAMAVLCCAVEVLYCSTSCSSFFTCVYCALFLSCIFLVLCVALYSQDRNMRAGGTNTHTSDLFHSPVQAAIYICSQVADDDHNSGRCCHSLVHFVRCLRSLAPLPPPPAYRSRIGSTCISVALRGPHHLGGLEDIDGRSP